HTHTHTHTHTNTHTWLIMRPPVKHPLGGYLTRHAARSERPGPCPLSCVASLACGWLPGASLLDAPNATDQGVITGDFYGRVVFVGNKGEWDRHLRKKR